MTSPIVTIVTPSFNQARFIRATIESVLSQDYPNIEYTVMDGGSADETASIVREYASRLRFVSEKDRGQSHAINKGFTQAKGSILAWLNSDDVLLPGAITKVVDAFRHTPDAGAVYGEGFLIDVDGKVTGRFPHTEPLNLWRLVYLSDYILQQSTFFRADVVRQVGFLDENLHYAMDWDIFVRIAKLKPLEYIPEYLGCLREYPETKSSAGGAVRVREIRTLLQRNTGLRLPPGHIVYGLETYHRIWCEKVDACTPRLLRPVSQPVKWGITTAAGLVISHTILHSQGLYKDGWAAKTLRYMLPPGRGCLVIEGSIPERTRRLRNQRLDIECNGTSLGRHPLPDGPFQLVLQVPADLQGQMLNLKLRARRSMIPSVIPLRGDRRRISYILKEIRWTEPACTKATAAGAAE